MNGKFIGIVVGAVVAIMLVGSLLIPIIDETTSTTEPVLKEGALPCLFDYKTDNFGSQTITYTFNNNVIEIDNGTDQYSITPAANGTIHDLIFICATSGDPEKIGAYRVSRSGTNLLVYWEYNGRYYQASTNNPIQITINETNITISQHKALDESVQSFELTSAVWMATPDKQGDYGLWFDDVQDDAVQTIQTPGVPNHTYYLAPAYTEGSDSGSTVLYYAIPMVILTSLLVAVAAVAFKRD